MSAGVQPRQGVVISNWAEVHSARPTQYFEPTSPQEVATIVSKCKLEGQVVRVVGAGHSPNDCAMSSDVMISLKRLNRVLVVDVERNAVKIEAGITLRQLNEILDLNGLAMPNLGSISDQSVAGAIATGTHGTGAGLGSLSSNVLELQLVDGCGQLVTASALESSDLFKAALCSFGSLGIVTGLVLQVVPAFDLHAVETEARLADVLRDVGARCQSARYYRFWWFPHTDMVMEWRANPVAPRVHRSGYTPSEVLRSRTWVRQLACDAWAGLAGLVAASVAWFWGMLIGFHLLQLALWVGVQLPALVPWINRAWRALLFSSHKVRVDRSDRCFNFNCLFRQHVDEWAIGAEDLPVAMVQLRELLGRLGQRAHFPIEVRFVAEDDAWLSPCYRRFTAYIGIIAYKPYGVESEYAAFFREFEVMMLALGGRPHWAKDFHLRGDAHFAPLYPRWHDFKCLRAAMDPCGVFVNPFVKRTLGLTDDDVRKPAPAGQHTGTRAARTVAAAATRGTKGSPNIPTFSKAAADVPPGAGGAAALPLPLLAGSLPMTPSATLFQWSSPTTAHPPASLPTPTSCAPVAGAPSASSFRIGAPAS